MNYLFIYFSVLSFNIKLILNWFLFFYYIIKIKKVIVGAIVFKPGSVAGPVQGPGCGFWPGHSDQIFLNQNDVVLEKKISRLQPCFWPGQLGRRVTPDFSFPYFFFNPA
jgi:hypothetical protein